MTLVEAIKVRINALTTTPELRKRVTFTLVMFVIARIGIHIGVPGLNMELFKHFTDNAVSNFLNIFSSVSFSIHHLFYYMVMNYVDNNNNIKNVDRMESKADC